MGCTADLKGFLLVDQTDLGNKEAGEAVARPAAPATPMPHSPHTPPPTA